MAVFEPTTKTRFYVTNFDATENPISESSRWVNGLATGLDWSDMQTSGGRCYGTQTGAVSPPYDDSCAYLLPETGKHWSADQEIEAQVSITTRSGWTGFHEVELLLRGTLRANYNACYECLFPCTASTKLELVQWKGPFGSNASGATGNPDSFSVLAEQATWPGLQDGDWIKATIVGTVITMQHRTNSGSYTTYITHDTAGLTKVAGGDPYLLTHGMPGIGHWKNGNGNLSDHGITYLRIKA